VKYHDYHLSDYEVSDFGKRVTLRLVYNYPGKPRDESHIEFADVALYNFTHTAGSIITHIEEVPVVELIAEIASSLKIWVREQGVDGWADTAENYAQSLLKLGRKAWRIDSAIGFAGFVIARSVEQVWPRTAVEGARRSTGREALRSANTQACRVGCCWRCLPFQV
jgi:hypothetical protein